MSCRRVSCKSGANLSEYTMLVFVVESCLPSIPSCILCGPWHSGFAYMNLHAKLVDHVHTYTSSVLRGIEHSRLHKSGVRDSRSRSAYVLVRHKLLRLVSSCQQRCPMWFRVGCAGSTTWHSRWSSIVQVVRAERLVCVSCTRSSLLCACPNNQ